MPVLITGATGLIGRALAARLREGSAQVRAYVRRDDAELRALGAHLAIGSIDDVQRLEAALTGVHTLVHLVGGWWPERGETYDHLNRESAENAAIAARAAEVRRIVFVSVPGADPASPNELLASKGRAEEHVRASGLEHVILRSAPVREWLPRLFARLRKGPLLALPGDGSQPLSTVSLTEVVAAVAAADDREAAPVGVWDLADDTRPLDAAAAAAGAAGRRIHGLSPGIPAALAEVLARGVVADGAPARAALGLSP